MRNQDVLECQIAVTVGLRDVRPGHFDKTADDLFDPRHAVSSGPAGTAAPNNLIKLGLKTVHRDRSTLGIAEGHQESFDLRGQLGPIDVSSGSDRMCQCLARHEFHIEEKQARLFTTPIHSRATDTYGTC